MSYKELVIGELVARKPIVQGGMGVGVSLHRLAAAIAREGGIGVISAAMVGFRESDYEKTPLEANLRALKKEVTKAKEESKGGIVGVNIMVATKFYEQYVAAAVEADVDMIICGAGLPTELPKLVGDSKVKLVPIVSSEKSARVICKMWDRKYNVTPDMIVIEGPLAGGHLGFSREDIDNYNRDDYALEIERIRAVIKEYEAKYKKSIPIVVAGGIYDKADVDYVMSLGVDGVQVSTRFVTTQECDAGEAFKQAYIDAKAEDIVIVQSPVGMPGRAIRNAFIKKMIPGQKAAISKCYQCIRTCNQKDMPYCISRALINSVTGNTDEGLIFCGAKAYKANKIEQVSSVMEELMPS